MLDKLFTYWQPFEKSRITIIDALAQFSNQQLNKPEDAGKWSVLQHVYHIYLAEKLSLAYLNKKMQAPDKLNNVGFKGWLRLQAIKFYLKYPIKKFNAPPLTSKFPDSLSYTDLVKDWQNLRTEMLNRYQDIGEDMLDKDLYKHPLVGKMNIYQATQFNHAHLKHHEKAIRRIVDGFSD